MDDLARWLGEQLDEDERIARAAAKKVSAPPNDGIRWRRDWDTVHTAPSDPPGPRRKVADCGHGGGDLTAHIVAWDPARVLREIDAKRKLIAEHQPDQFGDCATCARPEDFDEDSDGNRTWSRAAKPWPCPTLRLLALPHADRPGFKDDWRP